MKNGNNNSGRFVAVLSGVGYGHRRQQLGISPFSFD
jgi:hypothetical protein